jgi:hypothetical protein
VWFAPVLQIIGGGNQVGPMILFTMIADVFPEEER